MILLCITGFNINTINTIFNAFIRSYKKYTTQVLQTCVYIVPEVLYVLHENCCTCFVLKCCTGFVLDVAEIFPELCVRVLCQETS